MQPTKSLLSFFLLIGILCSVWAFSFCHNKDKLINSNDSKDRTFSVIDTIQNTIIQEDYFDQNYFRYNNYIYKDNIKTVLLHIADMPLSYPIFQLNAEGIALQLSFDELDTKVKDYYYTVIHCNAYWQPSALLPTEYINGFTQDIISDYSFSRKTIQSYIHYKLIFPNSNMQITKSGNYIIKVFLNNNPDEVVLTQRFLVTEDKIKIQANVHQATAIIDRNYKQEVDFTILPEDYPLTNPYEDLKVVLLQNFRWDNAIIYLKPQFVKEDRLDYNYDDENVFDGGNEFRFFEITNYNIATERIQSINYISPAYHFFLYMDERRAFKMYLSRQDINGKYLVRTTLGEDSETDADYVYVHFSLLYDEPIVNGNLYVFGAFSNWQFKEENKLQYNYEEFTYETTIYLKQGYYNYEYVLLEDGTEKGDNTYIEGNHYETENDYYILVYHRANENNYDQLLAIKLLDY